MHTMRCGILLCLLLVTISLLAQPAQARQDDPQPYQFAGTYDTITPKMVLLEGLSVFSLNHGGRGDFNVSLVNDADKVTHQLISWRGTFSGGRAVRIAAPGLYRLKIEATAGWHATIHQPRPDSAFACTHLTGSTTQATRIFGLTPGEHLFSIEYRGQDWFAANLLDHEGFQVATLAETKGGNRKGYATEFVINAPKGGVFIIDVQADDRWDIWVNSDD